jgi:AAA+ ATPase superfamily predicted ATPase
MASQVFIGREAELAKLGASWEQAVAGVPQLVAVWGRRRVGKTYLLNHFAAGRPHVYFTATRQDSEARQLERLYGRISEQLGSRARLLDLARPADWSGALRLMIELADGEPLLVVIDEMPRLLAGRPDFADLLSAVWENYARDQRLMLAVTGSAVSAMESMLGAGGGLRGRPQLRMRLDPFDAAQARAFLPGLPAGDFVIAYAACGGYPLHLRGWREDLDVNANLLATAFEPGGVLLADALDILSEDLDWRSGYERVLAAIGTLSGVRRGKIASRANQRIDYTLTKLQQAGYVRAEYPLGAGSGATAQYGIADVYLAFWLTVLRDDAELIEGGQGRAVLHRQRSRLDRHISATFEQLAREHAVRLVAEGSLPPDTVIGRWWRDEVAEIDVLGLSGEHPVPVLVGEAKWQHDPMTKRDLHAVLRKSAALPDTDATPQLAFWARNGFEPDALAQPGSQSEPWVFRPADMF